MEEILVRLSHLRDRYPKDIKLYSQDKDGIIKLMKGIGRIPGRFNPCLLEFLKFTNGASILDYCFFGFKNRRLGYDLDTYMTEFWHDHNQYAGSALPFMRNTSGEHFCICLEPGYSFQSILYLDLNTEAQPVPIASTFLHFLKTFISDIEDTLLKNETLYVTKASWPLSREHWTKNDLDLIKILETFDRMRF